MLRPPRARRVFVVSVCVFGLMYAVLPTEVFYVYTEPTEQEHANKVYKNVSDINPDSSVQPRVDVNSNIHKETPEGVELKYMLRWNKRIPPLHVMDEGQTAFYRHDCEYKNCFITHNRTFLGDITKFDAIEFNVKECPELTASDLPKRRLETQKYIFGAAESAQNYPICDPVYDDFFNWTWTYRLNSDILWKYITIYDLEGHIVGPKPDMKWPELAPVSDEFKKQLESKYKVVAWFVSHCRTMSKREKVVATLSREAKLKYSWDVDVYGGCGILKCPRERRLECFDIIRRDYYFYLSFENSFGQDYVTEKLLNALNNDAVPIVFGSADYSRFLPPGSYLDAREIGPIKLAESIDAIYKNKTRYYDFFRWKNHFRYKYQDDVCNVCAAMNDKEAMRMRTVYKNFRRWWNEEPCIDCGFESRSIPVYVFLVQYFLSKII